MIAKRPSKRTSKKKKAKGKKAKGSRKRGDDEDEVYLSSLPFIHPLGAVDLLGTIL